MPDLAQQDMSYQPTTKAYSFSTSPVPPANSGSEQEPKGKTNPFLLLAFEILGLIFVFVVFLLILNYFKVISLSTFLPKSVITSKTTHPIPPNNADATPPSNASNAHYDPPQSAWITTASGSGHILYNSAQKIWLVTGNYQGVKNNKVILKADTDLITIDLQPSTVFEEVTPNATSSSTTIQYPGLKNFIDATQLGDLVMILSNDPKLTAGTVTRIVKSQ
jgi:hypothetical protein